MARTMNHPPVEELGEVAEKYAIGTAEILTCPQAKARGMEIQTKETR